MYKLFEGISVKFFVIIISIALVSLFFVACGDTQTNLYNDPVSDGDGLLPADKDNTTPDETADILVDYDIPEVQDEISDADHDMKPPLIGFITLWQTDNIGVSENNQISLPLVENGIYNFTVDWGDETQDSISAWDDAKKTHTYTTPGVYTVVIEGDFMGWSFQNEGAKNKLREIIHWGDILFGDTTGQFHGCTSLKITATDTPNLSKTKSLQSAFENCSALTTAPSMNRWDMSTITNMSRMFKNDNAFNQNISDWDVGNVTEMNEMFYGNNLFNQDLSNWDVSQVTSMSAMFSGTSRFNQDIGSWNVRKTTDMHNMFYQTNHFNQDLSQWNVGNVTNMSSMFDSALLFNQDLSQWNVEDVTDMSRMFSGASAFNQDVSNWSVSKVTTMAAMFSDAIKFNYALSDWETSSVTTMKEMFSGATSFNSDISKWNVSQVTDMEGMFAKASSFNQPLEWNVAQATTMKSMFSEASSFNQNISQWDVSEVTLMAQMFRSAVQFNQDISPWNVAKVTDMASMFWSATAFNQDLSAWNIAKVTTMCCMFDNVTLATPHYSNILITWSTLDVQRQVELSGGQSKYNTSAVDARAQLISEDRWSIRDGGKE